MIAALEPSAGSLHDRSKVFAQTFFAFVSPRGREMSNSKTQKTGASVSEFLESVDNPRRREDGFAILGMMRQITGLEPEMWGPSIIGFGEYHYQYASGREGDIFLIGFAPRKQNVTLYLESGFGRYEGLLAKLGKHRRSVACLYINKLADVDLDVLRELIDESFKHSKADLETPSP